VASEELETDLKEHPNLAPIPWERREDAEAHLVKCHKYLMSPDSGPLGYLYQRQVLRVRELKGK